MNLSGVSRKKAFLGNITTAVRNKTRELCHGHETILDVCCGNGLFFLNAGTPATTKRQRVGIDRSDALLKEAQKIFHDNAIGDVLLVRGDALQLPIKPGIFGRVVCINTLLNLPSLDVIESLLVELMRACRADGKILVDVRNKFNPYICLRYWMHARSQKFPVKAYRVADITGIFERHGFRHTRILPIGCPVGFLAKAFLIEAGRKE